MTAVAANGLAVSMGDPCGVGPETIVRAAVAGSLGPALIVGAVDVMRRAVGQCGERLPVARLVEPADLARAPPNCLAVWEPPGLPRGLARLEMGKVTAAAGAAAAVCVRAAAALARSGDAIALVTAPIHKAALAASGEPYPGHTELLQALVAEAGVAPAVRMMLANDELKVVLATAHMALRRAIATLDFDVVLDTLRIAHRAAAAWSGAAAPRIAVAGLNPHAGEGGLLGDEEERFIAPAIAAARAEGIDALGPFSPDTVFMRARGSDARRPEFDLVVAMTHDHGLIPIKYLGIERGVNVTLGLPFVRTCPDHGTAFDIAGRGVADPSSLAAAAALARRLAGAWPAR